MELISRLIAQNDRSKNQLDLYQRYRSLDHFQHILEDYFYYEIPHLLDYYCLKEQEIGDLAPFFKAEIANRTAVLEQATLLRKAFKQSDQNDSYSNPYTNLSTAKDFKVIEQLCNQLAKRERDAAQILVYFFDYLLQAKQTIQNNQLSTAYTLSDAIAELPADWYGEPWYYIYVQYFGTDEEGKGHFEQLIKMLDYLDVLGIKNIYILPHYESPNGDAGYDISAYRPAECYGGVEGFRNFMQVALLRGFRVATDLVFNHCSVEHDWFQRALAGEAQYYDYFLKCPSSWGDLDVSELLVDEAGDLFLNLPEKDELGEQVTSKRILIFPDVDQTLWLKQKVEKLDKVVLFYREFYPFQVDMDIQQPQVMRELFSFLAEELGMGIMGKRTDAIAHWVKQPGTDAKNLPQTYALQQLIKQFLKHVNPRAIILPEVVTTSKALKGYAGESTTINGELTTTGGDALLDFQLQAMLREMVYFQKTTPFWTQVFDLGPVGTDTAVPLIPIEHHDETYMGFIQELEPMRHYLGGQYIYKNEDEAHQQVQRGIIYKNGMSAGARYADALNRDQRRIANAFFCLYLMPGTPVVYYGTEIGARNNWEQMKMRQHDQFDTLLSLLGPEIVGPEKAITFEKCLDPRELQRGSIAQSVYYEALEQSYPAVELIGAFNALRKKFSALRSYTLTPVDTYDASILGMIRYPIGPEHSDNRPILALSNLSERSLTASIPFTQLQTKLGVSRFTLIEKLRLEGDHSQRAEVSSSGYGFNPGTPARLDIALRPYSAILFEICRVD
ncbi:MAG: alpha-amylase family glycosyl hydrolase [Bacteroidota bacterium]